MSDSELRRAFTDGTVSLLDARKVYVDSDMVNNPFWEVRIAIKDKADISTKEAILLASQALSKVDKIVIMWDKVPIWILFKKTMSGIIGWERSSLQGTIEDIFKSIDWKSCEELGVEE